MLLSLSLYLAVSLFTQNSQDKDIRSTLLSQNREILDRLNKVDQIKEKPAQVAPIVEEGSLRELIEAQKVEFQQQMSLLTSRIDSSENKIKSLEDELAKKDKVIVEQQEKIEEQNRQIEEQKRMLQSCQYYEAESPRHDLLEANTKLIEDNEKLKLNYQEKIKNMYDQIKINPESIDLDEFLEIT